MGADHRGFFLKEALKHHLAQMGHRVLDLGTDSPQRTDYPIYAERVARAILGGKAQMGILICGTGIGMSIAANRFRGIRAALVHGPREARLAKAHNHANVLCLSGDSTPVEVAVETVAAFLEAQPQAGRHARRVEMVERLGECE